MSRVAAAVAAFAVGCGPNEAPRGAVSAVLPSAQATLSATSSAPAAPGPSAVLVPPLIARGALPCGDAKTPALPPVQSEGSGILEATIARDGEGALFVEVTSYGSFPIPSRTAKSRSSHTQAHTSWGFASNGGGFTAIGDVGQGKPVTAVEGQGAIVLGRSDASFFLCDAGRTVPLSRPPEASRPHASTRVIASSVDRHVLTVVFAEETPHGPPCARLTAGMPVDTRLFVDQLDLATREAGWRTLSTRAVQAPTRSGCYGVTAVSAAVDGPNALVVLESCKSTDAGDSISITDCSLTSERLTGGAWTSAALAGPFGGFNEPVVSRDALRVAVPLEPAKPYGIQPYRADGEPWEAPQFQVFRANDAAFAAEGAPVNGIPVALRGTKLVAFDTKGEPGPSGTGYRLIVYKISGKEWSAASDPLESTARAWAFDLRDDAVWGIVANESETRMRVYRTEGPAWKAMGTLDAPPSP